MLILVAGAAFVAALVVPGWARSGRATSALSTAMVVLVPLATIALLAAGRPRLRIWRLARQFRAEMDDCDVVTLCRMPPFPGIPPED